MRNSHYRDTSQIPKIPTILPSNKAGLASLLCRCKGGPLQDVCRKHSLCRSGKACAAAIAMKIPQVDCLLPFDPSRPNADWCGCCISLVLGGAQSRYIKQGVKQPKLGPRTLGRFLVEDMEGSGRGLRLPHRAYRDVADNPRQSAISRAWSLLSGFVFVKISLSKTFDILVLHVSQRVL